MDDPSSDDAAVDPNGHAGKDNRGGLGYIPDLSNTKTNASGEAYMVYALSPQPGDNYRFSAASRGEHDTTFVFNSIQIDGTVLKDAQGNGVPVNAGTSYTQTVLASSMDSRTGRFVHLLTVNNRHLPSMPSNVLTPNSLN